MSADRVARAIFLIGMAGVSMILALALVAGAPEEAPAWEWYGARQASPGSSIIPLVRAANLGGGGFPSRGRWGYLGAHAASL